MFLLAALLATLLICLKVASVTSLCTEPTYRLYAAFDNIDGLKAHPPARIGDVVAGRVADITFDPKACLSRVELDINKRYDHILDTSPLTVRTSSLLGEQHLALNVGFGDPDPGTTILKGSSTIQDTKSAMVLEDLVGQFLCNSKGGDSQDSGNDRAEAEDHTNATPAADMAH